jgi:hypothetical protein
MYIISAIPGACGDIVSSVIDPTDCVLSQKGLILFRSPDRKVLKSPDLDLSKVPALLEVASCKYSSISSQYSKIIYQQDCVNQYIAIDITDDYTLDWCVKRLQILYPTKIFEKDNLKNEIVWHRTYGDHLINLSDVLSGNLINELSKYVPTKLDEEIYLRWLDIVLEKFPYSLV